MASGLTGATEAAIFKTVPLARSRIYYTALKVVDLAIFAGK